MLYDESPQWAQPQLDYINHPGLHSHSDLLRSAIYTNALHGSGHDLATLTPAPIVTQWQGLDMADTFNLNMASSANRQQLEKWGWHNTHIDYELNSWGFRSQGCREFDTVHSASLITMGCSFTFGTGLPESAIWPKLVAGSLGLELINISTPGQGLALGTRWLLTEGDTIADPAAIVVLIPPAGRITWIERMGPSVIGNTFSMTAYEQYSRVVKNIDINSFSMYMEHFAAIRLWAQHRGIPLVILDGFPHMPREMGLARDLRHHGAPWHAAAAVAVKDKLVDML